MTHKDLEVYKHSMDLVIEIYQLTEKFPSSEQFGLTSQLRRAAVSVPSNIAEGSGRNSTKEFLRFLSISTGSLSEVETQIVIAHRLEYIESIDIIMERVTAIKKMLFRLKESLNKKLK